MISADDIVSEIHRNSIRGPITRTELIVLINQGKWEIIGRHFGFDPVYTDFKDGSRYFDWTCCNKFFWRAFRPERKPSTAISKEDFKNVRVSNLPVQKSSKTTRCREALYAKQNGICAYCSGPVPFEKFTLEHRIPKSKGGRNHGQNVIGACTSCNNAKGSMPEDEFRDSDYLLEKRERIMRQKHHGLKIDP